MTRTAAVWDDHVLLRDGMVACIKVAANETTMHHIPISNNLAGTEAADIDIRDAYPDKIKPQGCSIKLFLTRIQGFVILRLQMQQYAIVVKHASSCDQITGVKSTSPCRFTSAKT